MDESRLADTLQKYEKGRRDVTTKNKQALKMAVDFCHMPCLFFCLIRLFFVCQRNLEFIGNPSNESGLFFFGG